MKSVVLSAEVSRAFQVAPAHAALMDSVTEDSLRVARVAQAVTRHMVSGPTAAAVASDAFMAGMLHQVGLLVLAAKAPARLLELAKLRASSEEQDAELERQLFGTTHPEIGAYLLGLWGLPYAIGEAVQFHRTPAALAGQSTTPAAILAVARALVDEGIQAGSADALHSILDMLGCKTDAEKLRAARDKTLG